MQVWMAHNPTNYAVICRGGPAVYFGYAGSEHLADGLSTVDEYRKAVAWQRQDVPGRVAGTARSWAEGIAELLPAGGGRRLAADLCDPAGVPALAACGPRARRRSRITEHARSIKSIDELELMRWTIRVCEAGMARMYEVSAEPGRTEQESGPNCTSRTRARRRMAGDHVSSPPAEDQSLVSRNAQTTSSNSAT